ncbi:hypothetical protein [Deinococcus cellulosilyticus]|uniref:Uncharacterized protein n=1 Tax=Deinococcus cellulosilyticus (strain DSM 18568 / NBRC 106333 / KACC 11606 / 5516J-15) TaxID=1223518 RepID=A0A511MVI5_DEIC1|nr:hypothetical protein [Deinococcus cellulosilyticus]GEM44580.1 hypothetical protein DC3_02150 [Deinococcus cellulosilyticus NBRC 106333 = KACC 11606]
MTLDFPQAIPILIGLFLVAFLLVTLILKPPAHFNPLLYFGLLLLCLLPVNFWVFLFGLLVPAFLMYTGIVAVVVWMILLVVTLVLLVRNRQRDVGTIGRVFLTLWMALLLGPLTFNGMLKIACSSQCPI